MALITFYLSLFFLLHFISPISSFQLFQNVDAFRRRSTSLTSATSTSEGSLGVEAAITYLNNNKVLIQKLALGNKKLKKEMEDANFWTGGAYTITSSTCLGIVENGLNLQVECNVKGKKTIKEILVPFLLKVNDEITLKRALIDLAIKAERLIDTGDLTRLPFGEDYTLPVDFKWNEVPHQTWVRSYLYNLAADAVVKIVNDNNSASSKSEVGNKFQLKVNFPEVNPAFDTYRIGTILEMVRTITLALVLQENKKVRICVQQSLGEGVFAGMPLALSSMRPVLEKMDWGQVVTSVNQNKLKASSEEVKIKFGTVGGDVLSDDDDVIIVIAPQNVIGGMIVGLLDDMVKAANGRPFILINPLLADRPSSNNMMQIRGRTERREFADSFKDIFAFRLLYPSSGGYMFPIRGAIVKRDYNSLWVAYSKENDDKGREEYSIIAAFPPQEEPAPEMLSNCFTKNNNM